MNLHVRCQRCYDTGRMSFGFVTSTYCTCALGRSMADTWPAATLDPRWGFVMRAVEIARKASYVGMGGKL